MVIAPAALATSSPAKTLGASCRYSLSQMPHPLVSEVLQLCGKDILVTRIVGPSGDQRDVVCQGNNAKAKLGVPVDQCTLAKIAGKVRG